MENAELLKQTIESKDKKALNELFKKAPAIDLAEASGSLKTEELIRIFREVEPNLSADYFTELGQEQKEALIKALTDKELVKLINSQAADDVTDAIVEMPANLASRVMKAADPDMREDLNELLHYKKDTAGSIKLTIDSRIQQILEWRLSDGAKAVNAGWAAGVCVDPYSGEIVALASYPTLNPNDRKNLSNTDAVRNNALGRVFEPGSIFKPITMSIALETGATSRSTTLEAIMTERLATSSLSSFIAWLVASTARPRLMRKFWA